MINIVGFIAKFTIFLALAGNAHVPNGPPSIGCHILTRTGYVACLNHETLSADWVCYKLRPENSMCPIKRQNWFRSDNDVPDSMKVKPTCYRGTGYDRGHLAAYADQCDTLEKAKASFLMTNMSPQLPCFNRQIWRYLEAEVRKMAITYGEVHVCTGPVYNFDPATGDSPFSIWINCELAGAYNGIKVPDSFWKVVTGGGYEKNGFTYVTVQTAFLLDNKCYPKGTDLKDFVVDVDVIKSLTGLNF